MCRVRHVQARRDVCKGRVDCGNTCRLVAVGKFSRSSSSLARYCARGREGNFRRSRDPSIKTLRQRLQGIESPPNSLLSRP